MRLCWQIFAAAMVLTAAPSVAEPSRGSPRLGHGENLHQNPNFQPNQNFQQNQIFQQNPVDPKGRYAEDAANELKPQEPDTDLFALMSGTCSTLKVAGRDFACRSVAYAHSIRGRAYFTIALDDPSDHSHIISFSGQNGRRTQDNLYELTVDRMLLNSKNRPKVDGLPVPFVELSAGMCTQLGNFAAGHVSSIACTATDKNGKKYELRFESDGSPITVRRVKPSPPTIRQL